MDIDWGVERLRLSLFCSENATASDVEWKIVTGQEEAESRTNVPGGRRFTGKHAGGTLTLAHSGQRLDLVLQALPGATEETHLPTLGIWNAVSTDFGLMSERFIENLKSPIVRIAFGGVLLLKMSTHADCYTALRGLLTSVAVDPAKMQDLQYRINWTRNSEVAQIKLNRLTTWATIKFTSAIMQLTGDRLTIAPPSVAGEQFAVRLEFDHNTDAANVNPFSPDTVKTLYRELTALASENASKGEVVS